MQKSVIEVHGMMCSHCEDRVVKALSSCEGVKEVTASAAQKQVVCTFDEALISEQDIVSKIEEQGYEGKILA